MRYKDISIRKKILLSNFLMILIPTIFVCMIFAILLFSFSFLTNSSSSLIRNVLLNSSNYGPTLLIKSLNDELYSMSEITNQTQRVLEQLEKMNLHITIKENRQILYISKGYKESDIQQEFKTIAQSEKYEIPYILWNQKGMAFASELKNKDGKNFTIMFTTTNLKMPKESYVSWEKTKLKIKMAIIVTGFVMILLILLLGIFLTKKLSRYILQPLAKLHVATNEIKNGNLSTPLSATTKDEFGILCENFENMREQLVASDDIQKQYELQRKELIAGISHDLSTPLTSIQGYVSALLDGIADTPEKQQHYLQIIQSKTTHVNELVESLFLLSKLDMGEEPLHLKRMNLHTYLQDWICEEKDKYQEQSLLLRYYAPHQNVYVQMDTSQFLRVLHNLCENSIKYKKDAFAQLKITLTLETQSCLLAFQDDGIGAQNEDMRRMFERFYRADPARSSKIKGNGLGLSITRHIIELMNGEIWAEGEEQQGLCIYIRLPLDQEEV